MVCRLFCTNVSEVPMQFGYFAHIVRTLSSALVSSEVSVVTAVLRNTKNVFSLDYDGLLTLIPVYLMQIREVLKFGNDFDDNTKSAAVSILASLICLPEQYPDYIIPPIIKGVEKMPMNKVKEEVYELIHLFIKESKTKLDLAGKALTKAVSKAICSAFLIIHHESIKLTPQVSTIEVTSPNP